MLLAASASTTAVFLSAVAGWQRGGWIVERALWVAVGIVLVTAAHLLPALCKPQGRGLRAVGMVIWSGCLAATCYGHAVFFIMAQRHAGELRTAVVPVVTTTGRDLGAIERDRADVLARLVRVTERRCVEPCSALRIERATVTAKLEAIDAERGEAHRAEAEQDRAAAARTAALADPVTGAMTAFGMSAARADLVTGVVFAGVLEAVACFSWLLALRPATVTRTVTEIPVTPAQQGSNTLPVTAAIPISAPVTAESAPLLKLPVVEQADDVTRVTAAVTTGELRATVTEIRKFLGCSQARAAAVRKQLELQPTQ
ncbi:hypothetical protein [Paraburkholderia adhaesiva]|uniref:hypothetical protein n=1 Tax=Paraburkholderia adhaesiva TaxID=2883244 RepID=UPI001F3D60A5|nr:hypothetical protein [Paraburkholderia adhaesiva]